MALVRTWHALRSPLIVLLLGGIGYWLYHMQDLPWPVEFLCGTASVGSWTRTVFMNAIQKRLQPAACLANKTIVAES